MDDFVLNEHSEANVCNKIFDAVKEFPSAHLCFLLQYLTADKKVIETTGVIHPTAVRMNEAKLPQLIWMLVDDAHYAAVDCARSSGKAIMELCAFYMLEFKEGQDPCVEYLPPKWSLRSKNG